MSGLVDRMLSQSLKIAGVGHKDWIGRLKHPPVNDHFFL